MNLTQIIAETGRRVRRGKSPKKKLTNEQVKEVLEAAVEIMREGLHDEGRVEIQGFAVIERVTTKVKPVRLNGKLTRGERTRWVIRMSTPSKNVEMPDDI